MSESSPLKTVSLISDKVVRCMLIKENKKLEKAELDFLKGAGRQRIEDAAKLEGLTFEQALERKKGFRYLY